MSDPYTHLPAKQANNLRLGGKLRSIKGILGLVKQASVDLNTFTPTHVSLMEKICHEAEEDARKEFEDTLRKLDTTSPSTDQRTAEESRTYAGK